MARDIITIYEDILAEKANHPLLDELENPETPSNTAEYKTWAYITASIIYLHESLWDLFRNEMQELANRQVAGTVAWYAGKVYDFQYGDELEFINNEYQYALIDESKKIVKRVAIADAGGVVRIKAAKLNGTIVTPLINDERDALFAYIKKIAFAGTRTELASLNADKLRIKAKVYFSALRDPAALRADVEAAIVNFVNTIPFDGLIYENKLIDAIQAVDGVIDVELTDFSVKVGAGAYQPVLRVYQAVSGYYEIDADEPLDTGITYISQ